MRHEDVKCTCRKKNEYIKEECDMARKIVSRFICFLIILLFLCSLNLPVASACAKSDASTLHSSCPMYYININPAINKAHMGKKNTTYWVDTNTWDILADYGITDPYFSAESFIDYVADGFCSWGGYISGTKQSNSGE